MNKKQNQNFIFIIILVIVFSAVLGYYFSSSGQDNNFSDQTKTTENKENIGGSDESTDNLKTNYSGTIFYVKKIDAETQLCLKKQNEDEKVFFTDKEEDYKIKFLGGMSNDDKILVYMSPQEEMFGGSLFLISLDGTKEKIIDEFASSQAPIISPDREKIAYVLFSNAEFNYGFSLYVMNINGQNKTKIATHESAIANYSFSSDSRNIVYTKSNIIYTTSIENIHETKIADFDQDYNVSGISWTIDNSILVSLNDPNAKISKIIDINAQNLSSKNLFEFKKNIINRSVWVSEEMDKLIYIDAENNLNIVDLKNNSTNITKSEEIIKWQK